MNKNPSHILDSRDGINKIDVDNALGSIEEIGSQITQIWELIKAVKIDESYSKVKQVVVAGMGGSVLGTHVVQTLFKDQLKVPVTIAPDYEVPAFVDENTLVIASSYSGSTEETLAATQDAISKGAKMMAISSAGGKLAKLFTEKNLPVLAYDPVHNPSQCARMGLGYSIFGQIALFAKAGLIKFSEADCQSVLDSVAKVHLQAGQAVTTDKNLAKVLAFNLVKRIPVVIVAEHLEGVAHVFANQLNENAKTFADFRVVPELNHHLMEGMKFPENLDNSITMITVQSNNYHSRNQLRLELTEEVLEQNNLEFVRHQLESSTKVGEAFELITLGAYTAFYLAMIYQVNPIPNPFVDWFKNQLKERTT